MKLYVLPPSPNSMKVLAVVHHLNLQVDVQPVDMQSGFHRSDAYLAINPNGLMPTLVDEDFALWESNAIMEYLTSKAPGQTLFPQDARGRADVHRWMFWTSMHLGPVMRTYMYERVVKPNLRNESPDEDKVRAAEPDLCAQLQVLEEQLRSHGEYLVGQTVTLADFTAVAALVYAQAARLPLDRFPTVRAWSERVLSLPAWQAARPQLAAR